MIQAYPFKAWRYNQTLTSNLGQVVSLPYDKISPEHQQELYQRHPYNVVRLIKNLPEAGDNPENDPYTRAAAFWNEWRQKGILVQDNKPTMTLYTQRGPLPGGGTFERRAIQAVIKIAPYQLDGIRRHEKTLAKPLTDRLYLMRSTRANLGHIFALYPDPGQKALKLLEGASKVRPAGSMTDFDGVQHEMIILDDPAFHSAFAEILADKYLIIADGHHRYETAMRYRDERLAAGGSDKEGFNYVMLSLVGMEHPGLEILATHRVMKRCPLSEMELLASLSKSFDIQEMPSFEAMTKAVASAPPHTLGWFGALGKPRLLSLRKDGWSIYSHAGEMPEAERDLEVVVLHRLILETLIGLTETEIRDDEILTYVRLPEEGKKLIDEGSHRHLFLLRPTNIKQVKDMTGLNLVMPQKSTDFFPKIWSGFTMRSLSE